MSLSNVSKLIRGRLFIDASDRGHTNILAIGCYDNLWIVNTEKCGWTEWERYIGQCVLGKMANDDGESFNYYTKVLEMERLNPTGNYRVKIEIDGDLDPNKSYWVLLLSPKGDILEKCKVD